MNEITLKSNDSNMIVKLQYSSQNIQSSLDEIFIGASLLDYEVRFSRVTSMGNYKYGVSNTREELTFYKGEKLHYLRFKFVDSSNRVIDFVEVFVDENYIKMYICNDEQSFLDALEKLKSNL
ncbi:gp72 [Bacillus phage G]|uniref:Gp72 n=1 Tax=Bacillus phage G TaxID=2884420 RepID=G3MBE2_9CAUD|nr:gp72 [Bacillus phage G]AEO93343.1 gp72 [Bacillus phage G]